MDDKTKEVLQEVQALLECSNQNWLFGAGISCNSNIPLMYQLTTRIEKLITNMPIILLVIFHLNLYQIKL